MGIFDNVKAVFAPTPAQPIPGQPAVPAVPGQPVAPVAPAAPGTGDAGNIPPPQVVADPNNPTAPAAPAEPEAPIDKWATLWDTPKLKEGEKPPAEPAQLTQEQLQTAAAKVDFSSGITPELMATITAGGEEGQKALAQAMNAAAQQSFVQSTLVSNKLMEKAVADAIAAQQAKIPELLRQQGAANHLNESNPLFSNPAIKPVIEATQAQLLLKYPNATPQEITTMTNDFIVTMGATFAPQAPVNDNGPAETDWGSFLDITPPQ